MAAAKQGKVTFDQIEQHNIPPWAEWSDSYINTLQWNRVNKHSMSVVPSSPSFKVKTAFEPEEFFEDPAGPLEMPPDIQVHAWKHPHQIGTDTTYVVEPDPTPLDLITYNKHLLEYEIMRTIICSISCLQRESFHRPFPTEFQSDQFTANHEVEWKPWQHVYALTLAGKGQAHNPQYNPFGKYVVRLFFVGKWRRILVDDRLPVDAQGQVLLPLSRPDNLWLPLLSKALLKVAALSWVPPSHCVDFSVIHCLTGWIPTLVPCKGCSTCHLWCVCCQVMATTEEVVRASGCCRSDHQLSSPLDNTTGQSAVESRAVLAIITPKEYPVSTNISEQTVLIGNAKYDNEQPTPGWKQYRWNEWASSKGIISEIPSKPIRNVQIYNPLICYSKSSSEISNPAKNEVWLDFDDFAQCVRTLEVYYKPSYFKYSLRAWSDQELLVPPHAAEDVVLKLRKTTVTKEKGGGDAKSMKSKIAKTEKPDNKTEASSKPASTKDGAKGKKGKVTEDDGKLKEEWPKNLRKPSFFYLLMDSMASKDVLCSVSVYSPDRPPYAIIFIGRFEWHSPSVAPIINRMSTTATSARFFVLPPGLRVFRIWHQFPTYFCMQIFSNTFFQSGSKMSIQQSLTCDSVSYKYYGKEISSSFEQLLAAPQGGASHGGAYQQLIRSLEPPQLSSQLKWPQWFRAQTELVEAFEESLTEMLVESIHQPEDLHQTIQAFQLLFLNPVFGMKTLKSLKPDFYDHIIEQKELQRQKELLLEQELKEQLAQASEQKGKKGSKSDKSKKSIESPKPEVTSKSAKTEKANSKKDKNKPKPVTEGEQLRKLIQCKEKNLLINDQNQAIQLLKKMMNNLLHFRHLYPFNLEDDIKLVYRDYVGELLIPDSWVVLVRSVLNIHSTEAVPCSLHVWAPVENLVLRLIDNDTNEEVLPLGFVENNVAYLSRNKGGYTVCAYGVTDHVKPVAWRLRSMGLRETDCLHLCKEDVEGCTKTHSHPLEQFQQTVHGYYVPNKQNVIASCLLEVSSDVTVLLRLQLSSRYAFCRLTVTSEAGDVVCETSGTGQVMVAVLHLKGREEGAEEASGEDSISPSKSRVSQGGRPRPLVYRVSATLLDNSWPLHPQQMKAMLYYKENLPDILHRQPEKKSLERFSSTSGAHSHSSKKRSSSRSERSSTLKLSKGVEGNFENVNDKPSWSLTLVTDLQEEMPVALHLDMSVYEMMSELKKEWQKEGFDLKDCSSLRLDFLKQYQDELEDDFSEEAVFKLKPKKLDRLTELYGQNVSDDWLPERFSCGGSLGSPTPSETLSTLVSSQSLDIGSEHRQTTVAESVKSLTQVSSHASTVKILQEPEEKLGHTNVLGQQAGIHKALQNIRQKTLDHIKQIFKETAELREKIVSEMKMAKDAELETEKSKQDSKKGKKSKDLSPNDKKGKKSKDLSPTGTKAPKSSLKDSKKSKGGKGKGK